MLLRVRVRVAEPDLLAVCVTDELGDLLGRPEFVCEPDTDCVGVLDCVREGVAVEDGEMVPVPDLDGEAEDVGEGEPVLDLEGEEEAVVEAEPEAAGEAELEPDTDSVAVAGAEAEADALTESVAVSRAEAEPVADIVATGRSSPRRRSAEGVADLD